MKGKWQVFRQDCIPSIINNQLHWNATLLTWPRMQSKKQNKPRRGSSNHRCLSLSSSPLLVQCVVEINQLSPVRIPAKSIPPAAACVPRVCLARGWVLSLGANSNIARRAENKGCTKEDHASYSPFCSLFFLLYLLVSCCSFYLSVQVMKMDLIDLLRFMKKN